MQFQEREDVSDEELQMQVRVDELLRGLLHEGIGWVFTYVNKGTDEVGSISTLEPEQAHALLKAYVDKSEEMLEPEEDSDPWMRN